MAEPIARVCPIGDIVQTPSVSLSGLTSNKGFTPAESSGQKHRAAESSGQKHRAAESSGQKHRAAESSGQRHRALTSRL